MKLTTPEARTASRCGFVTTDSKPSPDHRGIHFIPTAAEQLDTVLYLRVLQLREWDSTPQPTDD